MGIIIFILNILSSLYISINIENKSITRFILLFWLTLCGQVVLISYLLSIFPLLTPLNFLLLSILFSTVAYSLLRRKKKNQTPDFNLKAKIKELTTDKLMVVFVFGITVIVLYNFVVALLLPSLNWDGSSYHVPRIYHWLQNQQIGHYPTHEYRQNQYPVNDSILMMWTHIVSRGYQYINLVQWFSYLTAGIGIYVLGRFAGLKLSQAVFSTCVFYTLPMVVLQSSTVQNDLVVTSFMVGFLFFLLEYIFLEKQESIIYAGMALGLGIGTKYTSVMLAPGILLMLIPLLYQRREKFIKYVTNIFLYCCIGIIFFSSFNFVENYIHYNHPLGSQTKKYEELSPDENAITNSVRFFFQMLDFTGLPEPYASKVAHEQLRIWKSVYEIIGIEFTERESQFVANTTYWDLWPPQADISGYGIIGLLFLLISPFVIIKKNKLVTGLMIIVWLWFITFSMIFFHTPHRIRYFCLPMSILCCTTGIWYENSVKKKYKTIAFAIIIILSIYIGFYTTVKSERKDLSSLYSITRQEYYRNDLPVNDRIGLKIISEMIEPESIIGINLLPNSREFHYYNILDASKFVSFGDDLPSRIDSVKSPLQADYFITNVGEYKDQDWSDVFDTGWFIKSNRRQIHNNPFIEISEKNGTAVAINLLREIEQEVKYLSEKQLVQIIEFVNTLDSADSDSVMGDIYQPIQENIFISKKHIPITGIYSDNWTKKNFTIFVPTILFEKNPEYSVMIIEMDLFYLNNHKPINVTCNGKNLEVMGSDGTYKLVINKEDIADFENIIPINFEVNSFYPTDLDVESNDSRELGWRINSIKYSFYTDAEIIIHGIYADRWTKGEFNILLPAKLIPEKTVYSKLILQFDLKEINKQLPIQVVYNGKKLRTEENNGYYDVIICKEDMDVENDIIFVNLTVNTFIPSELNEDSPDNRELGWCINEIKPRTE